MFGPTTPDGFPSWAQVTVKKLVHGQVGEFPATAFWEEYVQTTKDGSPNSMWKGRPKGQLSKCAEALALRKAFPAELSGVYSDVEMQQADNTPAEPVQTARPVNITREGQEEAGTPVRTVSESDTEQQRQEAAKRVSDMAARVRMVAPKAEVTAILDRFQWRNDPKAAAACYAEIKALGLEYAARATEAPQEAEQAQGEADVVDAELTPALASSEQRQLLSQHAARAGAKTSQDRAFLWGYLTGRETAVGTKELTGEQAAAVLDTLSGWDSAEAGQAFAEAQKKVLAF